MESEYSPDDEVQSVPVLSAFISRFRNAAPAPPSERQHLSGDRMWWLNGESSAQKESRKVPDSGLLEKSVDFVNDNHSTISSIKFRQSVDQSTELTSLRSSVDKLEDEDDDDDSVLRHADALYRRLCNNLKELQSNNPLKESLQLPLASSVDSVSDIVKAIHEGPPIDSLEFDHLNLRNDMEAIDIPESCDSPIIRDSLDAKIEAFAQPCSIVEVKTDDTGADELEISLTSIANATSLSSTLVDDVAQSFDSPSELLASPRPATPPPPPQVQSSHPPLHPPAVPPTVPLVVAELNSSVDSTSLFMYMSSDDEDDQHSAPLLTPPRCPQPAAIDSPLTELQPLLDAEDKINSVTVVETAKSDIEDDWTLVEEERSDPLEGAVTESSVSVWLNKDEELRFLWERLCLVRVALQQRQRQSS